MPRSFQSSWQTITSLASCFACFLDLQLTQPCKWEKERGTSNIGNFCNKNKHNISPMIIPLPPITLTFSTTSESLNSSSSANPHRLRHWRRNAIAPSPLPQPKQPLPKSDTIATAVLWPLWLENPDFPAKTISLADREHSGSPSMCYILPEGSRGCLRSVQSADTYSP